MYLVLSTFPSLWENGLPRICRIGGLNYICLGVGFFLGTQICAPCQDRIYRALKKRNGGVGKPEFRVPLMIPGAILVPVGLFIYGWSAQRTHPLDSSQHRCSHLCFRCNRRVSMYPNLYRGFVYSIRRQCGGAATVLRSLAGFGFPLFAPYMYAKLHYGWGNSLLAFIAIGWGGLHRFYCGSMGEAEEEEYVCCWVR